MQASRASRSPDRSMSPWSISPAATAAIASSSTASSPGPLVSASVHGWTGPACNTALSAEHRCGMDERGRLSRRGIWPMALLWLPAAFRSRRGRGGEVGAMAGDDGDVGVVAGAGRTLRPAGGVRMPEGLVARRGDGDAVGGVSRIPRVSRLRRPAQPAGLARLAMACPARMSAEGGRAAAEHGGHARTRAVHRTALGRLRRSAVD